MLWLESRGPWPSRLFLHFSPRFANQGAGGNGTGLTQENPDHDPLRAGCQL